MSPAQQAKYWWEWARVRDWYVAHGKTKPEADAMRHELHKKALGADKSTKVFTNRDLDKVFSAFRAIYDGGNLNAQMDAEDQPHRRRAKMEAWCINLSREVWPLDLESDPEFVRGKKLNAMAYRINKLPFDRCNDVQLAKIAGALEVQKKRDLERQIEQVEESDKNPF